ncbi:TrmH family RNA methyltransferase [Bacillus horti]|uniref:TrmH family RNA methyltransferase n=1 Tax=Caldalkalibacillus horti TaxID=77523 RepID=A0ABT9VWM9_9BACI|nr:RNA methyltransferase [Bacillus horti]MDQ0165386.1 TrmH family RNA methyltransferase [Bacillus horti]
MYIESSQNPRFKEWKKLLTKKGRTKQRSFLVEGFHLAEEAFMSKWDIDAVLLMQDTVVTPSLEQYLAPYKSITFELSSKLFLELSETEAPQGIIVIVKQRELKIDEKSALFEAGQTILVVDQVQDPGNMGTIIRTADAAGVDAIVISKGSADIYSGKTLRSTQGSIFHLPIIQEELEEVLPDLEKEGWTILASALTDSVDVQQLALQNKPKIALIVGNEGQGVSEYALAQAHQRVKIPIWGQAESLNVGVATGILLYSIRSQFHFM